MKVTVAKTAGFCFGVKRAVDMVYEQLRQPEKGPIYTYGPIIHNELVTGDLAAHGVKVLNTPAELAAVRTGTVVIRSHGVGREIYEILERNQISYVDASCPFVKRIHRIVSEKTAAGEFVLIIGSPEHPEVSGIRSWAGDHCRVLETEAQADAFVLESRYKKVNIVAQTTFNHTKFKYLVEKISKKGYDISVCNTICSATKERQEEARTIAAKVDAMIVIGDRHSSNTQKLFDICKNTCNSTVYVQTLDDLDVNQLRSVEWVGITAGASTPNKIIEEVQKVCQI